MKTKATNIWSRILVSTFISALLMPAMAFAQDNKDQKKQQKEAKENVKDDKRIDKTIKKYEESLAKANDKYNREGDFREDVDFEFRRLRREHAQLAFTTNTNDDDDWVVSNSGDKLPKNADTMYDNLLAQDYVNRVGQSLVPAKSENRYGFKVTVNPMPDARSLSTGTIYISTGLLSLVDNEAQLAYILAHEVAHVEREHWREDVLVAQWVEGETRSAEKKGNIIGGIAGGIFGGASGIILGAALGRSLAKRISNKAFEWSASQEDEADKIAMTYMLDRNYDIRETQNFYDTLKVAANEDPRIELDRFGDRKRSEERRNYVNVVIAATDTSRLGRTLVGASNFRGKDFGKALSLDRNFAVVIDRLGRNQKPMAEEMKTKIQNGELIAGDGEFEDILATVKRDNGIIAFYYDMYKLSERNLSQSLAVRSDDALGYFYYGKVLKLTARKAGEKEMALQMFTKAIDLDRRNANPQSRLYLALTKMSGRSTNNIQDIVNDLKQYVFSYQQINGGSLPPSMSVLYDYMQLAGEVNYTANAVVNVRNVSMPVQTAVPATQPAPTTPKRK